MDEQKINSIDLLNEVDATIMVICKKIQESEVMTGDFSYAVGALPELLAARTALALSI